MQSWPNSSVAKKFYKYMSICFCKHTILYVCIYLSPGYFLSPFGDSCDEATSIELTISICRFMFLNYLFIFKVDPVESPFSGWGNVFFFAVLIFGHAISEPGTGTQNYKSKNKRLVRHHGCQAVT